MPLSTGVDARSSFDGSLSPFSCTAVTVSFGCTKLPVPVVDVPAVGIVRLGDAAGDEMPRIDRHRAGAAAVNVVRDA